MAQSNEQRRQRQTEITVPIFLIRYEVIVCSDVVLLYHWPLVFLFELFYIVISGPFIADYAVWALLIVEGRTVTYSC